MKFKVGDKVRVRKDLEVSKDYGNCGVVKDMKEYRGKEFIIDKVWRNCYMLKDIDYYWTDEMLEPIEEGEKNNMNIEQLNLEYKNKMDKLMEEYKAKVKEVTKKEEPFIKKGQGYFYINGSGGICNNMWTNHLIDQQLLDFGNCFPYTEETKGQVEKEVILIAERRKLQSEMEMFARLNNDCDINWNDIEQKKWSLYINYAKNEIRIEFASICSNLNNIYFATEEIAQKALDKFGDRIKELYIDIEDE